MEKVIEALEKVRTWCIDAVAVASAANVMVHRCNDQAAHLKTLGIVKIMIA
jgi:hypothetical protein